MLLPGTSMPRLLSPRVLSPRRLSWGGAVPRGADSRYPVPMDADPGMLPPHSTTPLVPPHIPLLLPLAMSFRRATATPRPPQAPRSIG